MNTNVKYEIDYFYLLRWGRTWLLTGIVEKRGWCFDTADACIKYALRRCVVKELDPRKAIKFNTNTVKLSDFLQSPL